MALAGRKIRWKLSTDSGSSYVNIAGSIKDDLTFTFEPVEATNKDSAGVATLVDDIASSSVAGTVEMHFTDKTFMDEVLGGSITTRLLYLQAEVDGEFTATGRFFVESLAYSGSEGSDPLMQTVSIRSSGAVTKADIV